MAPSRAGKNDRVPEFVFLAHVVDMMSSMHVPFVLRSISSVPFANHLVLIPFLPVAFTNMLIMWCCSKTFLVSFYTLRGRLHQMWTVPRHGFQYFIPAAKEGINRQIELAILRADRMGVKVLSLAALNKVQYALCSPLIPDRKYMLVCSPLIFLQAASSCVLLV